MADDEKTRKPKTFTFHVPLEWTGEPWADDSLEASWLDAGGRATEDREQAVTFEVRLYQTGADTIQIERRVDEVNGGVESTVDLDVGISNAFKAMRAEFEEALWEDGRPKPTTVAESREQEAMIDMLYNGDANRTGRLELQRMTAMRDRQRVAAEWGVMVVNPPPSWDDLITRPMRRGVAEAIAQAYMRARGQAEAAEGK